MKITNIDHLVLCVADLQITLDFYTTLLGMEPREERPGKWSLHFGHQKISLQEAATVPDIARNTEPGSANFCLLTETPVDDLLPVLAKRGMEVLAGPDQREGATGTLRSIYFHDPDGNLVEVSNLLTDR